MAAKKIDCAVYDTNVLISDPECLSNVSNCIVVIPMVMIEELDKLKNGVDSVAVNARIALRKFDELSTENFGKRTLADGVVLSKEKNTRLFVVSRPGLVSNCGLDLSINDNLIIETAYFVGTEGFRNELANSTPKINLGNVTLVSNDAAVRVKANLVGVRALPHTVEMVEQKNLFADAYKLIVDPSTHTLISISLHENRMYDFGTDQYKSVLTPNKLILIGNPDTEAITQCISNLDGRTVRAIEPLAKNGMYGISAKNKDQRFAIDILMDDQIQMVSLIGKAGSGKTILALAAGLEKVVNAGLYDKVMIIRPVIPMGKDVGFLPGTLEEKVDPWFQPIYDNMEVISKSPHMKGKNGIDQLKSMGKIEFEIPTHIKGRSIARTYVIVDEAQNLSRAEIQTIISRMSEGSKIVLLGDAYQVDLNRVNEWTNGLVIATDKFSSDAEASKIFAYVNLEASVRSTLSGHAARIL